MSPGRHDHRAELTARLVWQSPRANRKVVRMVALRFVISALVFLASIAGQSAERSAQALAAAGPVQPSYTNTVGRKYLGIFPARRFRAFHGACADCGTPPQALWYFSNDWIAVPNRGEAIAGFSRSVSVADDVRQWITGFDPGAAEPPLPSLVWIGSNKTLQNVALSSDVITMPDGRTIPLELVPRISTNRSFYDASSAAFFSARKLRLHGFLRDDQPDRFVARTIWPQDFRFDCSGSPPKPLAIGESLEGLITADDGGARSPFSTRLLWEREPGSRRNWVDRAVLAILLNGAQGDDDEAHGGHFAMVTGILGEDGQWGDWLVNNFYTLDSFSENGIIAAMVPADNYMADLNSGQSWYRPSCLLAMVLRRERSARIFQEAAQRVYNRYYRHDLVFDHARTNCTGISMDVLRWIGWHIPTTGPTSRVKAIPAFFYKWFQDRSFASGILSYNYLVEEQTRLLPRIAFEAAATDVLGLLQGTRNRPLSSFERMLCDDIDGIFFARVPQFPSSRAFGTYAVASLEEYSARLPSERSRMKVVPVSDRPFPASLRDPGAFKEGSGPLIPIPILLVFATVLLTCGLIVRKLVRAR